MIGAGAFVALLDGTVANLALNSIRDYFHTNLAAAQWVVTAYLIALAVSLPAAGFLGTRYGYGRVWAGSLIAFTLGSIACALAPSIGLLIAARAIQGLAAGLMIPSGQAVIGSQVGPAQLGRVMGVLGVVISLGPAVGPTLAGFLLKVSTWHSLFWINVPIGGIALLLAKGLVPGGERYRCRPLDRFGLILLGLGLPLMLYGATELGAKEAPPSQILSGTAFAIVALVVGALMSLAFIFSALRKSHPLIDLRLFRCGTFAAASSTTVLTGANIFGGLLLLPLYLERVEGHSPLESGLVLLGMGLGSAAALYVGGTLTDRHGAAPVMLVGGALMVITLIPFMFAIPLPTVLVVLILIPRGVGIALAQLPAMAAAYSAVTSEQMGDAATLVNILQRVGGALGAVAVVVVLLQSGGDDSPRAYAMAFALLACISAFILLTGTFLRRHHARRTETRIDLAPTLLE